MNDLRKAAEMALEALEDLNGKELVGFGDICVDEDIDKLKLAIEQDQMLLMSNIIRPKGKSKFGLDLLNQSELASRWGVSEATLERDRSMKKGCRYMKIGGLIRYRLSDVENYEDQCTVETNEK